MPSYFQYLPEILPPYPGPDPPVRITDISGDMTDFLSSGDTWGQGTWGLIIILIVLTDGFKCGERLLYLVTHSYHVNLTLLFNHRIITVINCSYPTLLRQDSVQLIFISTIMCTWCIKQCFVGRADLSIEECSSAWVGIDYIMYRNNNKCSH